MNARRIAALALVGWYLMMPPVLIGSYPSHVNPEAPLSKWSHHGLPAEFPTEQDCKAYLADQQTAAEATLRRLGPHNDFATTGPRYFSEEMKFARCISTGDPRLKEK